MIVHTNCRHFRTSMPCFLHKQTGITCKVCTAHDAMCDRIVIVKLGAPGDVLRTTCVLAPLRASHPGCHVTWITRMDAAGLLAGNPDIDRVLVVESNYMEALFTESFDLVIGPDADVLSASIVSMVRAPEKRGFVSDGRGSVTPLGGAATTWFHMGVNDALKCAQRDTYATWLYRICGIVGPIAPPSIQIGRRARTRASNFLATHTRGYRRRVVINTGASNRWEEKRWKIRHYLALVELVTQVEPDTALLLVGGPAEGDLNRELLAVEPRLMDARTDGSYEEVAALIAACDWVLTPDSLVYHIACATGTAAVCLVGPTAPWELDRYERNLVLHDARECIACYRPSCLFDVSCMDTLSAASVWDAICTHSDTSSDVFRFVPGVHALQSESVSPQRMLRSLPVIETFT